MATNTIYKTAYYLRCRKDKNPFDLENIIQRARVNKPSIAETEILLGDSEILRIQRYTADTDGVYLQIVRYIPGEAAHIILPHSEKQNDDEESFSPPTGKEYKDGDCFFLIKKHNLIFCSHGISIQKAAVYIDLFLKTAGIGENERSFNIAPASNLDKIKLLSNHKVRSIELGCSAFYASLPSLQQSGLINKFFSGLYNSFAPLIEKDDTPAEQKALEDLLVNVEFRIAGNTRAEESSKKIIKEMAELVISDETEELSGFAIYTQNNERITPSDVRLHSKFKVTREGRSVDQNGVKNAMISYFKELTQENLLEQ